MSVPRDELSTYSEKPWAFRDTVEPRRTYCGRVVYERKKHYMGVKDALRILEKVQPPEDPPQGLWDRIWDSLMRIFLATLSFDRAWINAIGAFFNWVVTHRWRDDYSPWETIRSAYLNLVVTLISEFNLGDDVKKALGVYEAPEEEDKWQW